MQHNLRPPKRQYHFAKHTDAADNQEEQQIVAVMQGNRLVAIIVRINVMRPICSMMFGKDHPIALRMLTGVLVAGVGVVFAKYVGHSHNEIVAHVGDGVGYGLHALGLTPFIEYAANKFE